MGASCLSTSAGHVVPDSSALPPCCVPGLPLLLASHLPADLRRMDCLLCCAVLATDLAASKGADCDAVTVEGYTALHLAARGQHLATLFALLNSKCSAVGASPGLPTCLSCSYPCLSLRMTVAVAAAAALVQLNSTLSP